MLWGRKSLLPKVGITGIDMSYLGSSKCKPLPKVSANLVAIKLFVFIASAAVRGIRSSLSCRDESPVHTTKSTLSLIFSAIHLKVSLTSEIGESQSEVSAP